MFTFLYYTRRMYINRNIRLYISVYVCKFVCFIAVVPVLRCMSCSGVQISWRLVFVLEYLGPLLIFPALYFYPSIVYGVKNVPPKTLTQT